MSLDLKQYIYQALSQGASRDSVVETLRQAGWSGSVVQKTLDQFTGVDTHRIPIPAPRMLAHQVARDLCVYFLMLVTLSMSAVALGGLLFNLINYSLPDPAGLDSIDNRLAFKTGMNWSIAQLIVAFPVYSWLMVYTHRDIRNQPEKRESWVRKLMTYLILVATAVVGLGDLVSVLTTFLNGEITGRFLAKSLVVLGIAAMIFIYYLFEMRRDDRLIRS